MNLTAERLRQIVHYDPETGIFTWKMKSRPHCRVGDRAGHAKHNGYRAIGLEGIFREEHRLAWLYMTGEWPDGPLDHINRKPADNRWANLRRATCSQNQANRPAPRSDIPKGVTRVGSRWQSQITIRRKYHYLGRFKTMEEAAAAYERAAREAFGEFACFELRSAA